MRLLIPFFLYLGIALLALIWRFLAIPWDAGGLFFQVWVTVMGAAVLGGMLPRLREGPRRLASLIVLPSGALLLFGSLNFAPPALFPFLILGIASMAALSLWSLSRKPQAILVSMLLIPLGAYCYYGLNHMLLVVRLRSLHAPEVAEVRLFPESAPDPALVLREPRDVEAIVTALRDTTPYSPNHEHMESPWRLVLAMDNGASIEVRIAKGNRAHPSYLWMQFGVEVYQNPALRGALRSAGVDPWH